MVQILDLQKQAFPMIGMRIKNISETPILQVFQYRFIGTWRNIYSDDGVGYKSLMEHELIAVNWQDTITGLVINNNELLKIIQCY